ncbi:MAG: hypothetical protein QNI99_02450 [Woeseiaceae bacterium]|nr:hypothetical protein [Woeseiaceae bacterium]
MLNRFAVLAAFSLLPFAASAQGVTSYSCTYDEMVRRVEILTEPGVPVPCEVHYHKDTEAPGQHQVLWSAQNDAGYCEAKTAEFVAKLEGWGWSCSAGAAPSMPEAAEEPMMDESMDDAMDEAMDDTEALAPAEEMAEEAEEAMDDGADE